MEKARRTDLGTLVPFWTYKFEMLLTHSNKDIGCMNLESWEKFGLEIYVQSNQHTDAI